LPGSRFRGKKLVMESFEADAVVIGAGVVGLAVARRLALDGLDTIVLEKNDHIGMETSARNSEVIHAGIYYPQGSLKARLCVEGKRLLYDFCDSHGVPHKRLGKLVVGHAGQEAQIAAIAKLAADNGVDDLKPLGKRHWSRRSAPIWACSHHPPASSTATSICWPCWATGPWCAARR